MKNFYFASNTIHSKKYHIALFAISLIIGCLISGCGSTKMEIKETYYFAVPDIERKNINFYRLKITGEARLGVAEYRSGWFPADAVEGLFGDTSSENGASTLKTRMEIKKLIDKKVLETTKGYLNAAGEFDAKEDNLTGWLKARQRILAYPSAIDLNLPGTREIAYNPAKGLIKLHSDEKMVFMLSNNPDEIINHLSSFAQNNQSVLNISNIGDLFLNKAQEDQQKEKDQKIEDLLKTEAVENARKDTDKHIAEQIKMTTSGLKNLPDKDNAIKEIGRLIEIIDHNLSP